MSTDNEDQALNNVACGDPVEGSQVHPESAMPSIGKIPGDSVLTNKKAALVNAALSLLQHMASAGAAIEVPDTTPPVYILIGDATALGRLLPEAAQPRVSEQADERALPWTDRSTAVPVEKARRVLRHLIKPDSVYFFSDGFPRNDCLSKDAECVLAVLDSLTQQAAPGAPTCPLGCTGPEEGGNGCVAVTGECAMDCIAATTASASDVAERVKQKIMGRLHLRGLLGDMTQNNIQILGFELLDDLHGVLRAHAPVATTAGCALPVAFMGIDPLNIVRGASLPMIPDSWRYGFYRSGDELRFGAQDNGPLVAWDAVKDLIVHDRAPAPNREAAPQAERAAVPEALFDGKAVYDEVMANDPHTPRPTADNIADVLDAVVRLMRRSAPVAQEGGREHGPKSAETRMDTGLEAGREVAQEGEPGSAQAAPTDLSKRLREAADAVMLQQTRQKLMLAAADEIERYYGGMLAWKKTAEANDRESAAAQAAPADLRDAGIDYVADWLDKKRIAYDYENAMQEPDTGSWIWRSRECEEYSNTLAELVDEIRALRTTSTQGNPQ